MRLSHLVSGLLLLPTVVAAALVVPTSTASAASCSATEIAHKAITDGAGHQLSDLRVFYSGKQRSSKICAMNQHVGASWGKSLSTTVSVETGGADSGKYAYYAGPVRGAGTWNAPSIHIGGNDPSVPGRSYCIRIRATTSGHLARIWLCDTTDVSR